jgi:hypothetical protein
MSDALLIPMAAATGVVVIVVAIAVVLVVLIVSVSMRGRQKRGATRRAEDRQELAGANERPGAQNGIETSRKSRPSSLTSEIVSLEAPIAPWW